MHEKTKIADIQTQSMLDHIGRKFDPFVLRRKVNIFSNDPKTIMYQYIYYLLTYPSKAFILSKDNNSFNGQKETISRGSGKK